MIYFFDDYESFCAEKFIELLPEERVEKYLRLRQMRDKENCVAAYLLLRYALMENGINSFEIATGENGKPYLKDERIFFNLSHCSQGVAVAVDEFPLGIDVQEIGELKEKIAKRFFSKSENEKIFSSADKAETFTRLWTLKESVIKNEGKSIANIADFPFENYENFFEKYGKKFSCLREKNILISACGERYFDRIKIIKTEDFL